MSNFRIPYTRGNKLGRDHLYWPVVNVADVGKFLGLNPADFDNADITLKQMMALFWRVREWEFRGSWSVSKTIVSDTINSATMFGVFEDTTLFVISPTSLSNNTPIKASREIDQISNVIGVPSDPSPARYFRTLANYGVGFPNGETDFIKSTWQSTLNGGTPENGVQHMGLGIGGTSVFDPTSKLFIPPFGGLTQINGGGFAPGLGDSAYITAQLVFKRHPTTILSGTTPIVLTSPVTCTVSTSIADDFNVPMELQWRFVFEAPGSSSSGSGAGECSLTATKFWKYKNTRGEDVYDETNGQQINDWKA